MFACEFCEICKNTFSYRTHPEAAFYKKNTSEGIKEGENDQPLRVLRLKICDSHLTCKVANKCLNVRERVEVVE